MMVLSFSEEYPFLLCWVNLPIIFFGILVLSLVVLLDIFFIYISNVIHFPGFPSERHLPLIPVPLHSYCDEYPFLLWWVSLHIVVSEYPFLWWRYFLLWRVSLPIFMTIPSYCGEYHFLLWRVSLPILMNIPSNCDEYLFLFWWIFLPRTFNSSSTDDEC